MMTNFRNLDPVSRRLVGSTRIALLVDSGADMSSLPDSHALGLGVRLSTLPEIDVEGAGGIERRRGPHWLTAELCGRWVPIPVTFFPVSSKHVAVLGRAGAFEAMNVAFVHSTRRMLAALA